MKKKYIDPLLGKYIEMTRPEVPNSRLQQYVLTEAGRKMLEELEWRLHVSFADLAHARDS